MSAAELMVPNEDGVFEVVALSGGKNSTELALLLKERSNRRFNYVCTPTGNEPAAMFAHWRTLGELLGSPIVPIMATWQDKATGAARAGLEALLEREGMLPNRRARWCTRVLKIEPYREFLKALTARGPVVSHVGLRFDEEGRAGGAYSDIEGVEMRFLLRELEKTEADVLASLEQRGVSIPERTDCRFCYAQQIGEWFVLWLEDREGFLGAEAWEARLGFTWREPKFDEAGEAVFVTRRGRTYQASSRDTWPVRLADLRQLFEDGFVPPSARTQRDLFRNGACRACSL